MKYISLIIFTPLLYSLAHAQKNDDLISPGSLYCDSAIAMETKNYKPTPDYHQEILKDLHDLLKSITPAERAIMKIEGSGSPRLKDLDFRAESIKKKYKEFFSPCDQGFFLMDDKPTLCKNLAGNKIKPAKKLEVAKFFDFAVVDVTPPKRELTIGFYRPPDDMKGFGIRLILSTPDKEEEQIKKEFPKPIKSSLNEYLRQTIPAECFEKPNDMRINSHKRSQGKELEENSKEKVESSSAVTGQ